MNRVKVIFGGAFNPLTIAHLCQAEQICNEFEQVDNIVFVPVGNHYYKEGLISSEHRVNMLKKTCSKNDKYEISTVEVNSEKLLKTIDTLELLQEQYQSHELWFATGTDNLKEVHLWKEPEKLLSKFKLLVIERDRDNAEEIINNSEILSSYRDNIIVMKLSIRSNISSTIIRDIIKTDKSCRYLVPDEIFAYVNKNLLYR